MSKPVSKTLIGAFVVGAVALLVAGIAIFGSGTFFVKQPKFVMFFSGSVNGLTVGSPVQFRGVRIGQVTEIRAQFNPKTLTFTIPVYVEIDPRSIYGPVQLKAEAEEGKYPLFKQLLAKGLKAQLRLRSIITGQLYIAVDFHPEEPIRLVGLDKKYPEIPTIQSPTEVLMSTLEKVPFSELADKLVKVTDGIERTVNSPEVAASLKNLDASLKNLSTLLKNVNSEVKPLASSLRDTSDVARDAFAQAKETLSLKDGESGKLAEGLQGTLKQVTSVLEEIRATVASYNRLAQDNAHIGYEVTRTLSEIEGAARSLRQLADYLDRHPEALVKGKQPTQGE
jgi:paraquat-inducible protein B